MRSIVRVLAIVSLAACGSAMSAQTTYQPPSHTQEPPPIGRTQDDVTTQANAGIQIERDRTPAWELAEYRRLDRALGLLTAQRKGVIDAYVVAVGLDSDAVFGREAREAGKVLARRYDATGHVIVLAGSDGMRPGDLPRGSPGNIALVLARVAELMDKSEDVLVLYTTSHGAPLGIVYNDGDQGFGVIGPARLAAMLDGLGLRRRIVIVSACYAGVFVPALANADGVVVTAAASDRSSFGCQADSDWTFFGDALINHALRKGQPFAAATREAQGLIGKWEGTGRLKPSRPQIEIGTRAGAWLDMLDRRVPKIATAPVGRPAVTLLAGG